MLVDVGLWLQKSEEHTPVGMTTMRTHGKGGTLDGQGGLRQVLVAVLCRRTLGACEHDAAVGSKQSGEADPMEPLGEDVCAEESEEGVDVEGARALARGPTVVVAERDALVVDSEKSAVGDGGAVGVAGEVAEDLSGTPEGSLCVDNEWGGVQRVEELPPRVPGSQGLVLWRIEAKAVRVAETLEPIEELAAEHLGERTDGEQVATVAGRDPCVVREGTAPRWRGSSAKVWRVSRTVRIRRSRSVRRFSRPRLRSWGGRVNTKWK
jgi:hypothetical protein